MVRSLQNSEKKLLVLKISDIFDNAINSRVYRSKKFIYKYFPNVYIFFIIILNHYIYEFN